MREIRDERGLSHEQLLDESRTDRTLVGKLQRREDSPRFESLLRIAAGLGVPPSTLFGHFAGSSGT